MLHVCRLRHELVQERRQMVCVCVCVCVCVVWGVCVCVLPYMIWHLVILTFLPPFPPPSTPPPRSAERNGLAASDGIGACCLLVPPPPPPNVSPRRRPCVGIGNRLYKKSCRVLHKCVIILKCQHVQSIKVCKLQAIWVTG